MRAAGCFLGFLVDGQLCATHENKPCLAKTAFLPKAVAGWQGYMRIPVITIQCGPIKTVWPSHLLQFFSIHVQCACYWNDHSYQRSVFNPDLLKICESTPDALCTIYCADFFWIMVLGCKWFFSDNCGEGFSLSQVMSYLQIHIHTVSGGWWF